MATLTLPNGSTISISTSFAAAKTITAITNANPGVASATAHGYANGDVVVVSSGWPNLDGRVVRVASQATDNFALEGVNTTSTTRFPAGTGAGSAKKVSSWTQISGILGTSSSGGEQQFWEGAVLEAQRNIRIPTTQSASGIELTVSDDPAAAWYAIAKEASEDVLPRAIMLSLANGAKLFYYCYIGMGVIPSLDRDSPMTLRLTLSLAADPTRYAS